MDKILQFDLNGKLIKIWNNMNIISKELNIPVSLIYRNCTKEISQTHNYIFIKENDYNENIIFPGLNKVGLRRKIAQYSIEGELLNTFPNCTEAGKVLNINRKGISKCCKQKTSSYKGFVFKYI